MKTMSEDYSPFKMKGNPFTTGGVQGTNSHVSALKKKKEKDIHELVEERRDLKEKRDKLEKPKDGEKKILLGNLRRKRNKKKIEENQRKINENPTAQEWRRKGKKKKSTTKKVEEKSGTKGFASKAMKGAKALLEKSKNKKSSSKKSTVVDHPDGYSRDQESSLVDKIKEKGSDLLNLLKTSNKPITSVFIDKNKDGKDDRQ